MSEEEREAINIIKGLGIDIYDGKSQVIPGDVTTKINTSIYTILNLIEKQQKELEQEKEKNKELEKYKTYYEEMEEVNKKFIAVDKIKEKIEELEKELKEFQELDFISEAAKRYQQIQVLNNILEV